MTAETSRRAMLDWRDLVPEPEWHYCDCRFCDQDGEQEPTQWPLLVRAEVRDGEFVGEYVADRFLMVRADLAPIPHEYEATHPQVANATNLLCSLAGVTDERPPGSQHFRWSTLKALALTGWDLRVIEGSDKRVAVVDAEGDPIGVTIAATRICDDERSADFTRPYAEHQIQSFRPESREE